MRTGEGDFVDVRMRGQRGACGLTEAGHDVDHTRWNAGLHAELRYADGACYTCGWWTRQDR